MVQVMDWLGHCLTPDGLRPWKKKVNALLCMQPPDNVKQVRSFIGSVTYYSDMFPRRSHQLAPLAKLTCKGPIVWTDRQTKASEIMKAMMIQDCLLRYPDHNKPFQIYTDASNYQLGTVIMQDGRPVACYSRKLTNSQKNFTTMEKELLSIFKTFKEFCSMLLGAEIEIYTDHKNLTYSSLVNQRIVRQLNYMDEFTPNYTHIPGDENFLADSFSRLPMQNDLEYLICPKGFDK
jgi:hypothetical protein